MTSLRRTAPLALGLAVPALLLQLAAPVAHPEGSSLSPDGVRALAALSWLCALLGLLFVQGVLSELVAAGVAVWTSVLLLYATFLAFYIAYDPLTSLLPSFLLSALALWTWWGGRDGMRPARALAIGVVLGLAAVLRMPDALLLLLPAAGLVFDARRDARRALLGAGTLLLGFAAPVLPRAVIRGADLPPLSSFQIHPELVLESLFSSRHGLLYWTPVLWAGFLGQAGLARRRPRDAVCVLAPLLALTCLNAGVAATATGSFSDARFHSVLPHLALGLAFSLAWLKGAAARRPWAAVIAVGVGLTLWNFLFMDQYRRSAIPRDDTVSFARVTENNAASFATIAGAPLAWPANWLFALRTGLPPDRWDLIAGKRLFRDGVGIIDLGDGRTDPDLLGEGWGPRGHCDSAVCRPIASRARLFVPVEQAGMLDVVVRARGVGALGVEVNGTRLAARPLSPALADLRVRAPASLWRVGLNEVALACAGGTAEVDLVRLEQVPGDAQTTERP